MIEPTPPIFRMLRLVHTVLVIGMLLFFVVAFFVVWKKLIPVSFDAAMDRILQVVAIILSTSMIFFGFRLFTRKVMSIRNSTFDNEQKLDKYRAACVIWWAMIEGPGLFALVCFLLVQNFAFLFLGCVHLLILAVFMPKWNNIKILLNLV